MSRSLALLAVVVLRACAGKVPGATSSRTAGQRNNETAYIAEVIADPDGDDLAADAGEHVVIRSHFELRTDLGAGRSRTAMAIGCCWAPAASSTRERSCPCTPPVRMAPTGRAVFACHDVEVFDDDGDVVRLLDAGDGEVARIAYGTAAE